MFYEFFLNVFVTFNAIDVLFDIGINYIVNHYHMGVGFIDYVINNFFVGEVPGFLLGEHIGEIPLGDLQPPFSERLMAAFRHLTFNNVPLEQVTSTIEEAVKSHLDEILKHLPSDQVHANFEAGIKCLAEIIPVETERMVKIHALFDELAEHNE